MKNSIQILPSLIAERIAAGEVIERPASVVKELIENSIDAGARAIHVHLSGGGTDFLEIIDNGSGMTNADLELCVCRHATSKINLFEDLAHLQTLGFRGEALPSIASVSELEFLGRKPWNPSACLIAFFANTCSIEISQIEIYRGKRRS